MPPRKPCQMLLPESPAASILPRSCSLLARIKRRIASEATNHEHAFEYEALLYRPSAAPPADSVLLAPHRAIYDLTLYKSHSSRGIEAIRGRILYDFSGNACEGFELKFRQVSEIDSGEGKAALSDLRSTTWEDGNAKKFR